MAKRTRVGNNDFTPQAVRLFSASVDQIFNDAADQAEQAGRQVITRAQELQEKFNNLALAMREHSRLASESITKYATDMKHSEETLQSLIALHQGETTLEAIEDRSDDHLPRAGNIPENGDLGGNGVDHPRDLDEGQS